MEARSKVLITGIDGFTGHHLSELLRSQGYECVALGCNLVDREAIFLQVSKLQPDYVIHLAGISFVGEQDIESIYRVNVVGTINLLDALKNIEGKLKKVILASSATVYGDVSETVLAEDLSPKPVNHYGCSKLTMEFISRNYFDNFPIIITRPFNYTGINQNSRFLIPKIISSYKKKQQSITLGNLDVSREFNDVRDVIEIYRLLLTSKFKSGAVNICSGRSHSLLKVIEVMNGISGVNMNVISSKEFSRDGEIKDLSGNTTLLEGIVDYCFKYDLQDTLKYMYDN